LRKSRPKCSPINIWWLLRQKFNRGKMSANYLGCFCNFLKNYHPK
jgi:hypothetical protein